jgi:hypothetical protein
LFNDQEEDNFSMDESQIDDISQVLDEENNLLTSPCTEDKDKRVVFQIEHSKAPGSDGFSAEFYKKF